MYVYIYIYIYIYVCVCVIRRLKVKQGLVLPVFKITNLKLIMYEFVDPKFL